MGQFDWRATGHCPVSFPEARHRPWETLSLSLSLSCFACFSDSILMTKTCALQSKFIQRQTNQQDIYIYIYRERERERERRRKTRTQKKAEWGLESPGVYDCEQTSQNAESTPSSVSLHLSLIHPVHRIHMISHANTACTAAEILECCCAACM